VKEEKYSKIYWEQRFRNHGIKIYVGPYCIMMDEGVVDCEDYCFGEELEECEERMEYIRRMQEGMV